LRLGLGEKRGGLLLQYRTVQIHLTRSFFLVTSLFISFSLNINHLPVFRFRRFVNLWKCLQLVKLIQMWN